VKPSRNLGSGAKFKCCVSLQLSESQLRSAEWMTPLLLLFVFVCLFEKAAGYAAQAGLKFHTLLPQPPMARDYRWAPPYPAKNQDYILGSTGSS
jgi:hypothetical protein